MTECAPYSSRISCFGDFMNMLQTGPKYTRSDNIPQNESWLQPAVLHDSAYLTASGLHVFMSKKSSSSKNTAQESRCQILGAINQEPISPPRICQSSQQTLQKLPKNEPDKTREKS